jgi:hypothetical protein
MNVTLRARIDRLARECATKDVWVQAKNFVDLDAELDAEINEAKPRLLGHLSPWSPEDRATAEAFVQMAMKLASAGTAIAERCQRNDIEEHYSALATWVVMGALANYATATKWSLMSRRPSPVRHDRLHVLLMLAESMALSRSPEALLREGAMRALTAERHYLRTLLLPLVCGRGLDRQQVEIADSWLWTWVRDYDLARSADPGELAYWVDLQSETGLRASRFRPEGQAVRLVVVSKLQDQLALVVRGLHCGQIYPGFGLSTDFRIEAHVGVIEHVSGLLARLERATPERVSRRTGIQPSGAQIFFSLDDILQGACANPDGAVAIVEESDVGARLAVKRSLWERSRIGDLVGLRSDGDRRMTVAMVSRRPEPGARFEYEIEVDWISRDPRPLWLRTCETALVPRQFTALYLPGSDAFGRADSLLLQEAALTCDRRFDIHAEDGTYRVDIQATRHRGPGWVAAGFSIASE